MFHQMNQPALPRGCGSNQAAVFALLPFVQLVDGHRTIREITERVAQRGDARVPKSFPGRADRSMPDEDG